MTTVNTEPETIDWSTVATFAKKLAKGTKATTDWDTGLVYLARLPGWKVHRQVLPMPLKAGYDNNLEKLTRPRRSSKYDRTVVTPPVLPSIVTNDDKFELRIQTAASYKKLVSQGKKVTGAFIPLDMGWATYDTSRLRNAPNLIIGTPTAEGIKEGHVYFERFDEVGVNAWDDQRGFRAILIGQMWFATKGAIITAPNGQTVAVFDEPKSPGDFGADSFYTWGRKNGLYEDAKQHLEIFAKPPDPEEEDRIRLGGSLDETGVCSICDRRQKMHNIGNNRPLLYQHGYRIPTWAIREGWAPRSDVCFGAGLPPIELSPLGAALYLDALHEELIHLHEALAKTRALTSIKQKEPIGKYNQNTGERDLVEVEYTPTHPDWVRVKGAAVAKVESTLQRVKKSIPVYAAKWKNWKRTDTYDEYMKKAQFYTADMPPREPVDDDAVVASILRR